LSKYTTFSAGAQLARELHPTGNLDEAQVWQRETAEARALFANQVNVTLGGARDVREPALLATPAILIEPHALLHIRYTLRPPHHHHAHPGTQKGAFPAVCGNPKPGGKMK